MATYQVMLVVTVNLAITNGLGSKNRQSNRARAFAIVWLITLISAIKVAVTELALVDAHAITTEHFVVATSTVGLINPLTLWRDLK